MLTIADLSDDIAALKSLRLASERRVQERGDKVAKLEAQLNTRAAEIEHLKLWIAKMWRMQPDRKSEKLGRQIEQLELKLEDLAPAQDGRVTVRSSWRRECCCCCLSGPVTAVSCVGPAAVIRARRRRSYFVDVLLRVGQHPASLVHQLTPRIWKEMLANNLLRSDLHDLGGRRAYTAV